MQRDLALEILQTGRVAAIPGRLRERVGLRCARPGTCEVLHLDHQIAEVPLRIDHPGDHARAAPRFDGLAVEPPRPPKQTQLRIGVAHVGDNGSPAHDVSGSFKGRERLAVPLQLDRDVRLVERQVVQRATEAEHVAAAPRELERPGPRLLSRRGATKLVQRRRLAPHRPALKCGQAE